MSANQQQIDYWNAQAGRKWVASQERLDQMFAPLSKLALDKADPQPGERAIDIGCGCGGTSLAIAATGAAVWGIDISAPMLGRAKERAAGQSNVVFTETDAATAEYTPDHHLLFSRFGVMFFADPVAAFKNLRGGLVNDGRMVFVCWQKPTANPWMSIAGRAVQPFLPEPEVAPDPRAPGPFQFADLGYLERTLSDAGFTDLDIAPAAATLHLGDDLNGAVETLGQVGPVARVLQELSGTKREAALDAALGVLADHLSDSGVDLDAAVWLVSARRG